MAISVHYKYSQEYIMDTKAIIAEAKAKFSHNSAKEYLKDKYKSKLIFADQGGLWSASKELITFLNSISQEEVVILDSYETPIKVNRIQLYTKAISVYTETMNEWYDEWDKLRKKR